MAKPLKNKDKEGDKDIRTTILTDAAKILERQLVRFDRGGFRKELARLLDIKPSNEALQEFADKYPDKWAQTLTMLAGLAGFHAKLEVAHTGDVDPTLMTDVALLAEVRRLSGMLVGRARGAAGQVIEAEIIPSTPPAVLSGPAEGELRKVDNVSVEVDKDGVPNG